MPIQAGKRGERVTPSDFEAPFISHFTRFGMKGLNITDAIDKVEPDEMTRMVNAVHHMDGALTARPGMTSVATGGVNHHTVRRLNDPLSGGFTRVFGIDTSLYVGSAGALTSVDGGYSGAPLSMVPYRPPFSAETWMFIGDTARMRKVRTDGLDLPIGLPAPSVVASSALDTENRTWIADFNTDGTQPANWTGNAGFSLGSTPLETNVPTAAAVGIPDGTDGVHFLTDVSNIGVVDAAGNAIVADGYYSYWGVPKTMNLALVGAATATDDDYVHLWLNFSHTTLIQEFRIYLVCSATFSPSVVPGVSNASGANGDAYLKTFSSNDFAAYIQGASTQTLSSEVARVSDIRNENLKSQGGVVDTILARTAEAALARGADSNGVYTQAELDAIAARNNPTVSTQEKARTITVQSAAGSDQFQEFGVIDVPVRRGEFQRIGTTTARDWATVTGIITYVRTAPNSSTVDVRLGTLYMTGGSGPDSGEIGDTAYDYRYTHYDTRTGAEGNPSPIMAPAAFIDSLRRQVVVTPTAYGDGSIRQKVYRRGGTLVTDWYYIGMNGSDGGTFTDTNSDNTAVTGGTVAIDNDQPANTVDASGNTVLAQPLSNLWGPIEDMLFGCGDPYRPGVVYFCKPGFPDAWPAVNYTEVCSPSEHLMGGCLYGGQSFVFSTERLFILYPNLSGTVASVTATVTQCKRGMVNRFGLAVGTGGIFFINKDGIYRTTGGPEEWMSRKIDPLFNGRAVNGMQPIDFGQINALRLEVFDNELYFSYIDTGGVHQCLVYSQPYGFWRQYTFRFNPATVYNDEGNTVSTLLIPSATAGTTYSLSGTSDAGNEIPVQVRTGAVDHGQPRIEKRLGDQALNLDTNGVVVTLQNLLNYETITNPAETVTAAAGRTRAIFDAFGDTPQRATNLSSDLSWSTALTAPILYWLSTTGIMEPDVTVNRVTQWDDLGHPDESYVTGLTFDCDTGGNNRTIFVEYDFNGVVNTAAQLTVNTTGRHKVKFTWNAVQAHKVRIRPDDACGPWILYKLDWDAQPEPPRIAGWDVHYEQDWDQYYTGLDLYCDTVGQDKTIEVYVDQVLIGTYTVNNNGRKVSHITLPWGRGHVFHFRATDTNPGLLYTYRWHTQAEPSEQTNWNQNFTVEGTEAGKYLKALVFQCDTFGVDKTVTVECDGVVVQTLTVNTNGRKVVQMAFPQVYGNVFRVYPTDAHPSRLYSLRWVFDQEPLALDRWETQEIDHGIPAWHYPIYAHLCLRSTANVTMQVIAFNQSGVSTTQNYTITSTGGVKQKRFVPFNAGKGILYKYILTSDDPFWLYREETVIKVRVWGTDTSRDHKPFGNDDLDQTRIMSWASSAAIRGGGGTG